MKFSVPEKTTELAPTELKVGAVYRAKGGNKTRYWVIANIRSERVDVIGLDFKGEISQFATYNTYVFVCREEVGFVKGLDDLSLEVHFFGE